ncbi:MAG: hypothetical protein JWP44_4910 [Mucilaginibacter sp.]|nr:hypothetical protein [Mucilaginibacter sp.]
MSRNVYGRLVGEGAFESSEVRATFRSISLAWHHFLGFAPDRQEGLPSTAAAALTTTITTMTTTTTTTTTPPLPKGRG